MASKQTMSRGFKIGIFLFLLAIVVLLIALILPSSKGSLPVLGEPGHTVGKFSFLNQDGNIVNDKTVAGKIRVVEYFFTTCKGICPVMNKNLKQVQQAFRDRDDVVILSHTVDPGTDKVPVMKKYADSMNAIPGHWIFLTGDKIDLYRMAQQSYLLSADTITDANKDNAFIHTQYVTLVDKQNRIRGFYDATNPESINKLIRDIGAL